MNELASLGLILLIALLAGHLVQTLRIPEVTGYLLAGIALGPSVLGWVSAENLQALEIMSEVALGLILFAIGSVFDFRMLATSGAGRLLLTLIESLLTGAFVAAGMLALDQPWQIALLFGVIGATTAPASTLMVIRECRGRGPLSDTVMSIIAMNNIICIVMFTLASVAIEVSGVWSAQGSVFSSLLEVLYPMAWHLIGAVALGFLTGVMIAGWSTQVQEAGEMLILLAGSILLTVGAARVLDLSPLVASLSIGATMANLSDHSKRLFDTLAGTDPPFYAIFFVTAGARLDTSSLPELGFLGVVYLATRVLGKFLGARLGSEILRLDPPVRRYLGFALMAQADLAIGLVLTAEARYPEYAEIIKVVVLSSVAINDMIGPISARFAIVRAGEARALERSESIWALE